MLYFILTFLFLGSFFYYSGKNRALKLNKSNLGTLHSLPSYYGYYVLIWSIVPSILIAILWLILEPLLLSFLIKSMIKDSHLILTEDAIIKVAKEVKQLVQSKQFESASRGEIASIAQHYDTLQSISFMAMGLSLFCSTVLGGLWGWKRISLKLRARNFVENTVRYLLILSSVIAIFITIGIILSLLFESIRFFKIVSITEFLFGLDWNPQMAMRQDQVGSSGAFGALPLFGGTILITCVALSLSLPIGLLSAIYMAECSTPRFRSIVKPIIEILAGIPTVVYGFFAVVTVAPLLHNFGALIGIDIAAESAVGTGIVMGIMIIPFISSLSDDVICAVPESLRHGSFGLGATLSETIRYVVIPAALPGIVAGVLLAVSRAIGETMIVVMAAGLSAHLTANPFESVTTVTVQIVSLLVGDQEFDSPKTLSAFALGLVLFLSTLALNVIALHVVRKYREKYD